MLDFSRIKTNFFKVKLIDGTEIAVKHPTKNSYAQIVEALHIFNKTTPIGKESIERLHDLFYETLRNNKDGTKIDKKILTGQYSPDDLDLFFTMYINFVNESIDAPN